MRPVGGYPCLTHPPRKKYIFLARICDSFFVIYGGWGSWRLIHNRKRTYGSLTLLFCPDICSRARLTLICLDNPSSFIIPLTQPPPQPQVSNARYGQHYNHTGYDPSDQNLISSSMSLCPPLGLSLSYGSAIITLTSICP